MAPSSKIASPPSRSRSRAGSSGRPRSPATFPTAASSRPTLGSFPATAVFTRGEFTTAFPTARAAAGSGALGIVPHAEDFLIQNTGTLADLYAQVATIFQPAMAPELVDE